MFAVVRTGGKQYRVAAGDKIVVEKMGGAAGDTISLGDVLFAGHGGEVRNVEGLLVTAQIIAQAKADKVIVFKKRRRHNYRRKNGHRQQLTILRITAVGDEKYDAAAHKQATVSSAEEASPVPADQISDTAEPSQADRTPDDQVSAPAASSLEAGSIEPKAAKPRAKKPLKVETAESSMVDTPAGSHAADDEIKA